MSGNFRQYIQYLFTLTSNSSNALSRIFLSAQTTLYKRKQGIESKASAVTTATTTSVASSLSAPMDSKPAAAVTTPPSRDADALVAACGYGDLDSVASLLDNDRVRIDAMSIDGKIALGSAAENGHLQVVRLLLECGATADVVDQHDNTALCHAARHNHVEIVQELLDGRANADAVNNEGESPLFLAVDNRNVGVVTELLARGADIEKANNDGVSPLFAAAEIGLVEVINMLLTRGVNTGATDEEGDTPLHAAAFSDQAGAARIETTEMLWHLNRDSAGVHHVHADS